MARYEWASDAVAQLTCCGSAHTRDLDAAEQATRNALARALGDLPTGAETARTWSASDLGVRLSIPPGWVLVRSDFELVLLAPAQFQRVGPAALGAGPRPNGAAVRMWTVSRPGPYSLSDALRDSQAALARYGGLVGTEQIVVDGVEGVLHVAENEEAGWCTWLTVVAADRWGYFFEIACPSEVVIDCRKSADLVLQGLRLGLER